MRWPYYCIDIRALHGPDDYFLDGLLRMLQTGNVVPVHLGAVVHNLCNIASLFVADGPIIGQLGTASQSY